MENECAIDYKSKIAEKLVGEIRTFLDELINGTSNYKSLHNLTEQMTHDYSNRFLIELLQNGHDANEPLIHGKEAVGKIKIVLDEQDQKKSILYFANTGKAFSESNFQALARLGQSDKDPKDSVGNKGVGFRSVLQICKSPKIYSGEWNSESGFQGYSFEFNPDKKEILTRYIKDMIHDKKIFNLKNIIGVDMDIVKWEEDRFEKLQEQINQKCTAVGITIDEFFHSEIGALSPYLMPVPISDDKEDEILCRLGKEGYVTVVKLELNMPDALINVKNAIEETTCSSMIFLDRISEINIEHLGSTKDKNLSDCMTKKNEWVSSSKEIEIRRIINNSTKLQHSQPYWIWSKNIGGQLEPKKQNEIKQAVQELPTNWKDVDAARIDIALPVSYEIPEGLIYIYLPTEKTTDFPFSINAPFYGEINRKNVDISKKLNRIFIKEAASILYEAVEYVKDKKPEGCEILIADLICFKESNDVVGKAIVEEFISVLKEKSIELNEWQVIPYKDKGDFLNFSSLKKVYMLDNDWEYEIFSRKTFTEELNIKLLVKLDEQRCNNIIELAKYVNLYMYPNENEFARWAELIAKHLHEAKSYYDMWNIFYKELIHIIKNPEKLKGKMLLLGDDSKLHAAGLGEENKWVFLNSVQTSEEFKDEEFEEDILANEKIPEFLSDKIAFFNSNIDLYTKGSKPRKKTPLLDYITNGAQPLIERFSVESILDKIILSEMSSEKVSYDSNKSEELWSIFEWSMALYFNSRSSLESMKNKFSKIMVPCEGGWYPASIAYFSENFDDTKYSNGGASLKKYFDNSSYKCKEGLSKQVIKFEEIESRIIGLNKEKVAEFFYFCGVVDYLRLVPVKDKASIEFWGVNNKYLPEADVKFSNVSNIQYQHYKDYLQTLSCKYASWFKYNITNMQTIEGFNCYEYLTDEDRLNCAKLILQSIKHWVNWEDLRLIKMEGVGCSIPVDSLLKVLLRKLPWVPTGKIGEVEFSTLSDAWYIKYGMLTMPYAYSFLPYIATEFAQIIESRDLIDELSNIGLRCFQIRNMEEGFSLIKDLGQRLEDGKVGPELVNHYKGHYRSTWEAMTNFYTNKAYNIKNVPQKLVIARGRNTLKIMSILQGNDDVRNVIFIPDDKKLAIQLQNNDKINMLLIEEGKKYRNMILELYGRSIRPVSQLEQVIKADGVIFSNEIIDQGVETLMSGNNFWLLTITLAVAVFREDSQLSINGQRFKEITKKLRRAKLKICNKIQLILQYIDGTVIDESDEEICISRETETFLFTNESMHNFEELASNISEYISLPSLAVPLKYVFSKIEANLDTEMLERNTILQALQALEITEENYENIERMLLDDLGWTLERIFPAIIALTENNGAVKVIKERMTAVQNEEELAAIIEEYADKKVDSKLLIDYCKQVKNDKEMGLYLYKEANIELREWNNSLIAAGDKYRLIINSELKDEFIEDKNLLKNTIISILRQKAKATNDIKKYVENKQAFEDLELQNTWLEKYWELKEDIILKELGKWLSERDIDIKIVNIFNTSDTFGELEGRLSILISDLSVNYYNIDGDNRKLIQKSMSDIRKIILTYLNKNNLGITEFWLQTQMNLSEKFIKTLDEGILELSFWDEKLVYEKIITNNLFSGEFKAIKEIKKIPESYHELLNYFNIVEEDLKNTASIIEKQKENSLREKRLVKIKDLEFDTEESNLYTLSDIIEDKFSAVLTTSGSIENPSRPKAYNPRKKTNGQDGNVSSNVKKSIPRRTNKSVDAAIGLAGEIIAHNELLKEYGKAYTPDCWKSENRKYVFQGNFGDDTLGYDFELRYRKKKYHIEVKATSGNRLQFEMGSSETRQALEDAKRKKTVYRILFITQVLDEPKLYWLPNPFSKESSGIYSINEAGARISFNI